MRGRCSIAPRYEREWLMGRLRLQLDIPVEIVAPARVEIVGREGATMLLKLPAGRPDRIAVRMHVRFVGRPPALAQVARCAGRRDILPRRPPALCARNHMVEGQLAVRSAIDAAEAVAQEEVEPRERR